MLDRPQPPLNRDMPPAPGDPLGEALHSLRMTGVFYVRSELRAPWALLMPHWEDTLWFHVVVAGRAVLDTGDGLLDLRPAVIHVDAAESPQAEWTQAVVRLMAAEARTVQPGGGAVVTRLADVLVIQAIRSWIASDPSARIGWLGALRDPQIGQALALVHRDPGRPWTIAALAHEVAMSRSAFAARFAALVGEPVVAYLTRWRMQVAAAAIADGQATIGELANRLGYRSEAAFARAFKRVIGAPPGAVRATRA